MNKKISTLLTMGLVLGSSLLSTSAFAENNQADRLVTFDKLVEGRAYYVVTAATNATLAASDYFVGATTDSDTKVTWATTDAQADDFPSAGLKETDQWFIEKSGSNIYLKNAKNGAYIAFDNTGVVLATGDKKVSETATSKTAFLGEGNTTSGFALKVQGLAVSGKNYLKFATSNAITLESTSSLINFYEAENKVVALSSLKDDFGSNFSLNFAESLKGDSIFAEGLNLVTVTYAGTKYANLSTSGSNEFMIMVEGKVPSNGTFALTDAENKDFEAAKFIVLTANRLSGEFENVANGYKYAVMTGKELSDAVKATGAKINAENAQFTAYTTLNQEGYILEQAGVKLGDVTSANVWVDEVKEGTTSFVASRATDVHDTPIAVEAGKGTAVSVKDMVKGKMIVNVLVEKTTGERNFVSALGIDDATSSAVGLAVIENAQNAALTYPAGQWLISAGEGNNVTFINMQNPGLTESVRLYSTENANEYTVKGTGKLNGKTIKLSLVTPSVYNGYLNIDEKVTEGKTFVLSTTMNVLGSTNVPVYLVANNSNVTVTTNSDDATEWSFKKMIEGVTDTHATTDTIYIKSDYKYWDVDTLKTKKDEVLGVAFGYKLTANGVDAANSELAAWALGKAGTAKSVIFKEVAKDKYVLVGSSNADAAAADLNNEQKYAVINSSNNLAALADASNFSAATQFSLITVDPAPSLAADSKHVTFAINGLNYIAMDANNNGVVANETSTLKAATVEDFTFWIDSVDAEAVTPSFFISKGGKMMVNGQFVEDQIKAKEANFEISSEDALEQKKATVYGNYDASTSTNNKYRLKFTEATRAEGDTLMINDKKVVSDAFKFNIVEGENGGYVLKNGSKYVGAVNEQLVMANKADAVVVEVAGAEAPTSNESVSASEVKVIANNGSVVVKNAAGKNVVVSTILGQVVANEVLTSDNATINVPAGIVVVAVEGESFKVNVK